MSKGNPFLALRLSPDQQDALRSAASKSCLTLSDLVRQVLAAYLVDQKLDRELPKAETSSRKIRRAGKRPRVPSRPVRLQQAIDTLEDLLAAYQDWHGNLPDSLQDTATAVLLAEANDNLQQAVDLLNATTPPRGFGRD